MKNCLLIASLILFFSCKKEYDAPPIKSIPMGSVITISELKNLYTGAPIRFDSSLSVYATVTMDEKTGNLYKNVYVQDKEAAINLRLVASGGLYQGDSVRIYLKGTTLNKYNGMYQLDSVNVDNHVVKQQTLVAIAPKTLTVDQLSSAYQSQLIKLENVQFKSSDLGKPYADAVAQSTQNRTLEDCNGREIVVRTSGYAQFAGDTLPSGNGTFIGILGDYNGTLQLYLRNKQEISLVGQRCNDGGGTTCQAVAGVDEKFDAILDNTDMSIECWSNVSEKGTRKWRGRVFNADKYIQVNAYLSNDAENATWLVSPPVTGTPNLKLSFQSSQAYFTHNGLAVYLSINYDGTNVGAATWTKISSAVLATSTNSNYSWVNSGDLDLAGFMPQGYTGSVYVAFKYEGKASASQTGTFCIDNVKIFQ